MFENFEQQLITIGLNTIKLRKGGAGPPLLLLHGYPQTHVMWYKVAPKLAQHFTLIITDLRGYGDSSKPESDPEHATYSKRAIATEQIKVMETLGFKEFYVAGHDRGARVTHRMTLDYPERVKKAALLDIVPTSTMYASTDKEVATAYYHWFFLIQPFDLPETLIGANPEYYLRKKIAQWSRNPDSFSEEALSEYLRCFCQPATIHATCEDYRAAASIDLEHDKQDSYKKIACPLLVLWGNKGFVGKKYDVIEEWRKKAINIQGTGLPSGHFLPEETPEETYQALTKFFL